MTDIKYQTRWFSQSGLTLIELIIVIALAGILGAFAVGAYQLFFQRSQVDKATVETALILQQAQDYSVSAHEGKEYGVRFYPSLGEYQTIYRATPLDIVVNTYQLPGSISFLDVALGSGVSLYFAKLTGLPSTAGTITLGNSEVQKTISISSVGVIEIE